MTGITLKSRKHCTEKSPKAAVKSWISGIFSAFNSPTLHGKVAVIALATSLPACVGAPVVTTMPNSCSSLLPPDWKQGVAGADLPDGNDVGDWIVFGDAQTGKLDQANSRTRDSIGIVERCEARDAAAVKKATRGFWGRLF